ncbi:DUF1295-domain-containing protein [Hygrophoropsis aurantiaca]|uniref:DUF1295-domain-containing protein n=1 Tax=Hygrophoropsis aurantiaca TaxID=72124 RepID=A0ACB8AHH6_9AGAM|nr:DUF1295-domain-containing protein [Hygrophoropsis aurantiaca]
MSSVHVLDSHYLAITLLVTIAYQLLGFAIAWIFQFDKITDFTGGSNFFILALLTLLLGQHFCARNVIASTLVMVWAARLAGFLLFRVLKTGSDTRFDDIRAHFFKFLGFWIGQIVWVWIVSLPVIILNSPSVTGFEGICRPDFGTSQDIAGLILWGIGWLIESIADIQKYRYKSAKHPNTEIMNTGLWFYSRHPPYFGEIMCWWGIWIICLSPTTTNTGLPYSSKAAQYGAVVSPIFTTLLLMFGSGIPLAEKGQTAKFHGLHDDHPEAWSTYLKYLSSTSILIPLPPPLYRHLPNFVKTTVLLDFPMYRTFESRDDRTPDQGDEDNAQRANLI